MLRSNFSGRCAMYILEERIEVISKWNRTLIEQPRVYSIWVFPKIIVSYGIPKSSILIEFSIIFTIHFGVFPLFLETPISLYEKALRGLLF